LKEARVSHVFRRKVEDDVASEAKEQIDNYSAGWWEGYLEMAVLTFRL
jgi:hypothetical protein